MSNRATWLLTIANVTALVALTLFTLNTRQEHDALADRLAIQDIVTQYAYRWDTKDTNGFAELFTEDAVIERWRGDILLSRLEGRSALTDYARASHEVRLADRQTRHHMSGLNFLELSEYSAETENLVLITHQTATEPAARITGSGVYRNTWRKTDQRWQIAKRAFFTDRTNR